MDHKLSWNICRSLHAFWSSIYINCNEDAPRAYYFLRELSRLVNVCGMDGHNIHHFWGYSGCIDLLSEMDCGNPLTAQDRPFSVLQVSPYDLRHTLTTLCRACRHEHSAPMHLYIYEDNVEALARHLILLAVLLDDSQEHAVRMQRFLEVFGNIFLREDTVDYLKHLCRELETLLSSMIADDSGNCVGPLKNMLDISMLRYEAKDALLSSIEQARSSTHLDMKSAWDLRCRRWYGDRYDFRRNMIDWDYHMRLMDANADPPPQSIIHFSHFRHWRLTGVAFEVRDSQYTVPNQSLFSTAVGRTKDFKDRNCNDVGRSVTAQGLWSDILCSPYHSFGTSCEDATYFEVSNRGFKRTAVDISERNILALLHELHTGRIPDNSDLCGGCVHRARPARGPTTAQMLQDLQEAMQGNNTDGGTTDAATVAGEPDGPIASGECDEECMPEVSHRNGTGGSLQDSASGQCAGHVQPSTVKGTESFEPELSSPRATQQTTDPSGRSRRTEAEDHQHRPHEELPAEPKPRLDAVGHRLQRFKIFLVTGDFVKQLSGRRALAGAFGGATVGVMHAHLLQKSNRLAGVLAPGARVLVESAKNVVQVPKEHLPAFHDKVGEWAVEGGLRRAKTDGKGEPADYEIFVKPAAESGG